MTRDVVLNFTRSEVDLLMQPVQGQGGFQELLRRLQERVVGSTLRLTASETEKIRRYAKEYGQGGFQDRLDVLVQALDRAGA